MTAVMIPAEKSHTPLTPPAPATILLVEDDQMVRRWEVTVLKRSGYHVLEATDGEQALQLLAEHIDTSVRLIITDLEMPKICGAELVRQTETLYPHARILFTSGYSDDALQGVRPKNAFAFIRKPFAPAAFLDAVSALLADS